MKLERIVTTSFIISFVLSLIAASLKMVHSADANTWMLAGVIASIVFIVAAIYEVASSKTISHVEKTMWMFAFIFFSSIAGLIYILTGRRRTVARPMY